MEKSSTNWFRGAGAAETTSWAVGGAPHMSPTPIWLVGHRGQAAIAATGVSGAALNSLFYRSNCLTGSAGHSHCRGVLAASSSGLSLSYTHLTVHVALNPGELS